MNYIVRDVNSEIESRSLLKHAFYRMWSDGRLTREHLAGYSQEYFQLVNAVPELVEAMSGFVKDVPTRNVVSGILAEEREHVELWTDFAAALGVPRETLMAYGGTPETREAISRLRRVTMSSFCEGAAAMYAIESEQPRISRTKLDGLKRFYGMTGEQGERGTEYFREHEVADVRHAAVWRAAVQSEGDEVAEPCQRAAALSMSVQNAVLDSVMQTYVGAPSSC
jgi:pyrroloquinoline-quinone synthase